MPYPDQTRTTRLLGANATYLSEWVTDGNPHVGIDVKSDQDGYLYLDLSIDDGVTVSNSIPYEVTGGEQRFDTIVKLPGRSVRARYVNGPVAQTSFALLMSTGSGLYPYKPNSRNTPRFVAYSGQSISASSYAILIDLSDKVLFPHRDTGSVDLYGSFFFIDKSSNSVGQVQLGVITRVSATSADVSYIQGVSFNGSSDRQIGRDRVLQHPIQLGQFEGALTKVATQFRVNNVAELNTATPIPTPLGTAVPDVGDVIVRFDYTSGGSFNAAVSAQYAGNVSQA